MQFKSITTIAVLLLVVVSLSIAGCTQTTKPTVSPSVLQQATVTPKAAAEQVSIVNLTLPQQIGSYAPKAGYKFVGFNCTVKNINAKYLSTNPYGFTLRDTNGSVYNPTTATYDQSINGMRSVDTQPGDIVSGIIVYEVPQNATLKSLTYFGGADKIIITFQ